MLHVQPTQEHGSRSRCRSKEQPTGPTSGEDLYDVPFTWEPPIWDALVTHLRRVCDGAAGLLKDVRKVTRELSSIKRPPEGEPSKKQPHEMTRAEYKATMAIYHYRQFRCAYDRLSAEVQKVAADLYACGFGLVDGRYVPLPPPYRPDAVLAAATFTPSLCGLRGASPVHIAVTLAANLRSFHQRLFPENEACDPDRWSKFRAAIVRALDMPPCNAFEELKVAITQVTERAIQHLIDRSHFWTQQRLGGETQYSIFQSRQQMASTLSISVTTLRTRINNSRYREHPKSTRQSVALALADLPPEVRIRV